MRASSRILAGSLALAVLLTAPGCAGGGSGTGDDADAKAFSAQLNEPADLIPGNTNESEGGTVTDLLYTGLTGYDDETGKSVNLVAESVQSSDKKNWRITLRRGWKFHNGEQVTAQSFVGAWNATMANGWNNSYFFSDLLKVTGAADVHPRSKKKEMSGLDAVDDDTIEIHLDAPNANLPLIIGYTAFFPMPESVLRDRGWAKYRESPIGNGPYRMAEGWRHNQYIKLAKNLDYKGKQPGRADTVTFKIYSNPATAYNDVIAGNLDITEVPPERRFSAPQDFGDRYLRSPSSSFVYLGFPLWIEEYKDVRVRRAISMAIDREQIAAALYNDTITPAKGLVTPLVRLGKRDDPCGELCTFEPRKAKRLFDDAGGLGGKPVTLWYNTGAGNDDWMQAVANQLSRTLGVTVSLKGQTWAAYTVTTDERKVTGPFRRGWLMDYPGPENYLGPSYATDGSSNGAGYSNEKVDALLSKGNAATKSGAGIAFYHQAEDRVLDDVPVAPLWFGQNTDVHSERVGNVTYNALGRLEYDQIEVTG